MSSLLRLLPLAWAACVVGGGWRWRPLPADRTPRVPRRPAASRLGEVLERLGRPLVGGRDPAVARRTATALVAAAVTVPLLPAAAPAAATAAWFAPLVRLRRQACRAAAEVVATLPEAVDLVAVAVASGMTVPAAIEAVGARAEGPVAAALGVAARETAMGRRCADALDDLPTRVGEAVRPLSAALAASDRYGVPLGDALDRLADELRDDRRRRAEAAARRVPVKLLFPLVLCVLPAFGLLTVAPLLAGALGSLRL